MMPKCSVVSGMESWNRNRTGGQNPGNANQVQTLTLIISISIYSNEELCWMWEYDMEKSTQKA